MAIQLNKPVTGWYLGGKWNHLADGHASTSSPTPSHPSQKGWAGLKWKKKLGWLQNGKVLFLMDATAPIALKLAVKQVSDTQTLTLIVVCCDGVPLAQFADPMAAQGYAQSLTAQHAIWTAWWNLGASPSSPPPGSGLAQVDNRIS